MEVSLALAIASTISISVLGLISSAYRMQSKAQKMEFASNLARAKMTQILSMPVLDPTEQTGKLDIPLYKDFEYSIIIKEEQVDIAQIAQSGSLENAVALEDQLPTSVQNFKGKEKSGQNITETGGLIPIYRIRIIITYPLDNKGNKGTYEVQSFKAAKKL